MVKKILILLIASASIAFAQTVFEPVKSDVYTFLDLIAQKGVIQFNDEIRPVSREYIAKKLLEIKETGGKLTNLEVEELDFYLKDFGMEISNINKSSLHTVPNSKLDNKDTSFTTIINTDPYDRWRLFAYGDTLFKINASPILGYEAGTLDGAKYSYRWNGLYVYGYLANNIGYSFRFQDNSEDGTTIDKTKNFTPVTGVIISRTDLNNIQYDEIEANLAYNWSWGDLSVGKDYLNWGYGQSGLLVMSDKAPSFPFIRLDLRLTKWLSFNYIHAWLNSGVIDSTQLYTTSLPGQSNIVYRDKFLAQHTLIVTPTTGLDISVGESIVYSNQLQIAYLIPVMFFFSADHYLSEDNEGARGNSQFFLGISSRNQITNTNLYGTLFIDELSLEGIFNPATQRNQIGFTLGGSVTDLPVDNMTFTLEYTKIYPYVYNITNQTLTYQNNGYFLGDWIGDNADLIYAALNYRFIRGLQGTLWGQYIRKGAEETAAQDDTQPQPPFLFGIKTNYSYFGFNVKYEIIHEFFANLQYQTTKISAQQANLSFADSRLNQFTIGLYYGIH
ncbi:MAG: capsule assembly Wzi family protein [Ignavibacteriaceae bacterium]